MIYKWVVALLCMVSLKLTLVFTLHTLLLLSFDVEIVVILYSLLDATSVEIAVIVLVFINSS